MLIREAVDDCLPLAHDRLEDREDHLTVSARTVVALDDDLVAGTATIGPNRPGRGAHIATARFMVSPGARARGLNAVVETNVAAVKLWESRGFEVIGTVPGAFHHSDDGYVGLNVMFRDLRG